MIHTRGRRLNFTHEEGLAHAARCGIQGVCTLCWPVSPATLSAARYPRTIRQASRLERWTTRVLAASSALDIWSKSVLMFFIGFVRGVHGQTQQ